ncbi:MAG: hypothetical protein AB1711_07670 [Thermodesulfobacteriota bacterium]
MWRDGVKRVSLVVLFLLFFTSSLLYAEEAKKYPPYPDVWGYELPVYGMRPSLTQVAKMSDGDYLIIYTRERKAEEGKVQGNYTAAWVLFFAGASKDFEKDERGKTWKTVTDENRNIKYTIKPKVNFSDGSSIEYKSDLGNCADPFDRFLQKKDKNGKVIAEKILLYLYDKPTKSDINSICERNWDYDKDYYFKKVDNMSVHYLIPLEDDTFLIILYCPESIVALRFDKDLKTKSDLMGKNIFSVDRNTLINMRSKLKDSSDSGTSDALAKYLLKFKKED